MKTATITEILRPAGAGEDARREADVRAKFWQVARRAARQVPFLDEVVAGYYCALDKDTPLKAKGTLLAALAYFVMPVDIVPDFLAIVGFGDDIAVLSAAIAAIRPHIKKRHRAAAVKALAD